MKITTRQLALCAVLTALALGLSTLENLFPVTLVIPLPGVKLGLANIVTVFALYQLGPLPARCLLGSLFAGNASALLFSLLGGTLAMLVMLALSRLPGLSVYGVSIGGAAGHNIGQMAAALITLGNTAVLGLAKQAIAQYRLGEDKIPDLLNVCLDSPRRISEAYGPESIEVEDMYYRLDRDLADFLTFVFAQVKDGSVTVVLSSDHGTSPAFDAGAEEADRFNPRQFEVIVNGFLNVRYGVGDWVVDYSDKCLWLNHNLIYERGLNLAEVQNEVAIFAMQFSGISHALAATAMRTSYFGSGYARRMQNSFYPRRSGDVILNLMPGWIEEQERCWSMSGSMYGYDTEVPLVFYGKGAGMQRVNRRVDMTAVAPTLARLAGIREPAASEGGVLEEIAE